MAPRPESQPASEESSVQRTGGREPRTSPRSDAVVHEPRASSRSGLVVKGRNGENLSRGKRIDGDQFNIPLEIIPAGWRYQWNVVAVTGNADVARRHNLTMYAQGWRPVPANRHPGMFMPLDYDGPIEIEGQRLEERPEELCAEAEYEDKVRALKQMKDRNEALLGHKANFAGSLGQGLEPRTEGRGFQGRKMQLSIDESYEIAPPSYKPADDSQP